MRLIVFGIGQYCKSRLSCFEGDEIIAFLDNKAKVGDFFSNVPVYKPEKVVDMQYDAICLMAGACYAKEMHNQLLSLGVDSCVIYWNDREYSKKKKKKEIKIVSQTGLLSNDVVFLLPNLANTGGIRAAFYAMKVLKEKYSTLTVVTPQNGTVKEELLNNGYDLIISPDISENNTVLWKLIEKAEMIVLNGLYYGYLIPSIESLTKASILWWLHTGESFYKTYPIPNDDLETGRVFVAGVSDMVCKAYRSHNHNRNINLLPYGIPDEAREKNRLITNINNQVIFAIVGTVSLVKGIDVFLDAVKILEQKKIFGAEFWVIGSEVSKTYSDELHKKYGYLKSVIWVGEINHDELMDLYNKIDVLVSASREDMLPIVTIEAMMHGKACIVSDAVGTAAFINNEIEGLVFSSGNSEELARLMQKFIKRPELSIQMGKRGRELYENVFSEEVFRDNLVKYLERKDEDVSPL